MKTEHNFKQWRMLISIPNNLKRKKTIIVFYFLIARELITCYICLSTSLGFEIDNVFTVNITTYEEPCIPFLYLTNNMFNMTLSIQNS